MPHQAPIPPDVVLLLATQVRSVVQLEALLWMREAPSQELAPADLAESLCLDEEPVREALVALAGHGLVQTRSGGQQIRFVFEPSPALAATLDRLALLYGSQRLALVSLMQSSTDDALRSFANAFRLRKEP